MSNSDSGDGLDKRIEKVKKELDAATEKIIKLGIAKESGYMYHIEAFDEHGNSAIVRTRMVQFRKNREKDEATIVTKFTLRKSIEFMYCIDRDGDIARYPANLWNHLKKLRMEAANKAG